MDVVETPSSFDRLNQACCVFGRNSALIGRAKIPHFVKRCYQVTEALVVQRSFVASGCVMLFVFAKAGLYKNIRHSVGLCYFAS